jgi:hypothetical protein
LASPDAVLTALSEKYPWFEEAHSNAMNKQKIVFLKPSQSPEFAGNIIRSFIEDLTMRALVQPGPLGERSQLGTQSLWEHSE